MTYDPNESWFSESELKLVDSMGFHYLNSGSGGEGFEATFKELRRKLGILATRRRYESTKSTVAEDIAEEYRKEREQGEADRQRGGVIARP